MPLHLPNIGDVISNHFERRCGSEQTSRYSPTIDGWLLVSHISSNNNNNTIFITSRITATSTSYRVDDQEELDVILNILSGSEILFDKSIAIPSSVEELNSVSSYLSRMNDNNNNGTTNDPYLLAAAYIIQNDTTNIKEHTIQRYALATFYYTTRGDSWYNNSNWLSNEYYCRWYGITCCDSTTVGSALCTTPNDYGRILEFDLFKNNLVGTISDAITLLPYLQSIYFSENKLSGTIPGAALGKLSHLIKFHASYNDLSGTIPIEFKNNAKFSTMYVQGNNLYGAYPFCQSSSQLYNFGIDCAKVQCDAGCCEPIKRCFHMDSTISL